MTDNLVQVLLVRRVTEMLASPPEDQLTYLRVEGLGGGIDELALELEDYLALVPRLVREGSLSGRCASKLSELDAQIDRMSPGDPGTWTEHAVRTSPHWQKVRDLAGDALSVMPNAADLFRRTIVSYLPGTRVLYLGMADASFGHSMDLFFTERPSSDSAPRTASETSPDLTLRMINTRRVVTAGTIRVAADATDVHAGLRSLTDLEPYETSHGIGLTIHWQTGRTMHIESTSFGITLHHK